jgi:hypothetical protein
MLVETRRGQLKHIVLECHETIHNTHSLVAKLILRRKELASSGRERRAGELTDPRNDKDLQLLADHLGTAITQIDALLPRLEIKLKMSDNSPAGPSLSSGASATENQLDDPQDD